MSPFSTGRREFLRVGGGLAVAGFLAPRGARAAEVSPGRRGAGARSCILVYLLGGPPHLDMWDPKPGAPAEIRGPFQTIPTCLPRGRLFEHPPPPGRPGPPPPPVGA